jgi:hypothetical protein
MVSDLQARYAALEEVVSQISQTGDVRRALDPVVAWDAKELMSTIAGLPPLSDEVLQTRAVLGWLYWYRHAAGDFAQGSRDSKLAAAMFVPIFLCAGEPLTAIPDALLPVVLRRALRTAGRTLRRLSDTRAPEAQDVAMRIWRRIMREAAVDDPQLVQQVADLQILLMQLRLTPSQEPTDLDETVAFFAAAVDAAKQDDPQVSNLLGALATARWLRFNKSERETSEKPGAVPQELEEAFAAWSLAERNAPGHPNRPFWLTYIARASKIRYEWSEDKADLDVAVAYGRAAVAASSEGHEAHVVCLSNLGTYLRARYSEFKASADLDEAVEVALEAAHLGEFGVWHGGRVANVMSSLMMRFDRTGDPADLERAISAGRTAVDSSPESGPENDVWYVPTAVTAGRSPEIPP